MTYQIFVRSEAIDDLERWLKTPDENPGPWLESRVRIVTQPTAGWCVLYVDSDTLYLIKDNFDVSKIDSVLSY